MLNDTLMEYSIHFSLNWHLQTPNTAKETIWALCGVFGEFNGGDRTIIKGL
jgi:hypothetical protein